MIALHAYEHGFAPPRASVDFDVLADARMVSGGGTEQLARTLEELGFDMADPTPDGLSHRFKSGGVVVDLLAPDGLSDRTSRITIPPAHTLMVKGGTRALQRSETVEVSVGEDSGRVRRPDLLGSVVVKAAAVDVDDVPRAQERDLAFVLSLIEEPNRYTLNAGDRRQLRRRTDLLTPDHSAYDGMTPERSLLARRALSAFTAP
jgi:predicted nucleotidyltransferase